MALQEMGWGGIEEIPLAQDREGEGRLYMG